jgi:hypothetical protein
MLSVRGHTYYVGPPLNAPLTEPQPLPINEDGGLTALFREALLKDSSNFSVPIRVADHPILNCNFARCGEAAGGALWWCEGSSEAVFAFLPGLDEEEEDLVRWALATKPYPITLYQWEEFLKVQRPIYANFLLTGNSAQDRLLGPASAALAFCLFSILGVVDDDGPKQGAWRLGKMPCDMKGMGLCRNFLNARRP